MSIGSDCELDLNNEQKLILKILRLEGDNQQIYEIKEIIAHHLNWDLWLDLVKNYGVAPVIYRQCQTYLNNLIPLNVIDNLYFFNSKNTARNLALSSELVKIINILEKHNIKVLPYKGSVLSQYLYDDFTLRCSTDIDLIVPESDLHKVKNILLQANYKLAYVFPENIVFEPPLQWQSEYLMVTPNGKIIIDIHQKITRGDFFYPLPMNCVWNDLTEISFLGKKLYYFDVNILFFILATHGTKHCWESLNWLYDLVCLINNKQDLDLDKVIAIGQQHSHLRMILLTLALCQKLFNTEIPLHIQALIKQDQEIPRLILESCQHLFTLEQKKTQIAFVQE